jgi:hypothetical protein
MSPDPIDEALVEAEPPELAAPLPMVLLTRTGVLYFKSENPYYAAVVDAYYTDILNSISYIIIYLKFIKMFKINYNKLISF